MNNNQLSFNNENIRPLTLSDITNEILSETPLISREQIEDYGYDVGSFEKHITDADLYPTCFEKMIDSRDYGSDVYENKHSFAFNEEKLPPINKANLRIEISRLLDENAYLRDQLQRADRMVYPDYSEMYHDTYVRDRVKSLLQRFDEIDVVPRDMSGVTLTRGSNELVDRCEIPAYLKNEIENTIEVEDENYTLKMVENQDSQEYEEQRYEEEH